MANALSESFEPNSATVALCLEAIGAERVIAMWEKKRPFTPLDYTPVELQLLRVLWNSIPNPQSNLMTGYWHLYAAAKREIAIMSSNAKVATGTPA